MSGCFWKHFIFLKERAAASQRKCATSSERKSAADILRVFVAASENISCFLRNVRLLLKDINVQLLLKDNVQLLFRIMST